MGDQPHALLLKRFLWTGLAGQQPRPLPVIVALGPRGSGKSWSRDAMKAPLHGLVHAGLDFDRYPAATTAQLLAALTYKLSAEWKHRPQAKFSRFELVTIAAQTDPTGLTLDQVREQLRQVIAGRVPTPRGNWLKDFFKSLPETTQQLDDLFEKTVFVDNADLSLFGKAAVPAAKVLGPVLEWCARRVEERPWRDALNWLRTLPGCPDVGAYDALALLCFDLHEDTTERLLTDTLADAFLADVRANHPRLAVADVSNCTWCHAAPPGADALSDRRRHRHLHGWVLLLDNIDMPSGRALVSDLIAARERSQNPTPDPLLVVATAGRWDSAWEPAWRPVWIRDSTEDGETVPFCQDADHASWVGTGSPYYPVLVEPLEGRAVGRLLDQSGYSRSARFTARASGGLPLAITELRTLLGDQPPPPGSRELLDHDRRPGIGTLTRYLAETLELDAPHITIDDLVDAAPFITAPWVIADELPGMISRPQIALILKELRASLWVTTPDFAVGTPNAARLHPWIASALISALGQRTPRCGRPTYRRQFEALLSAEEKALEPKGGTRAAGASWADSVKPAYCKLALGRVEAVVAFFARTFHGDPEAEEPRDRTSHRLWVDRLRLVTRAPHRMRAGRTSEELYRNAVNALARRYAVDGHEVPNAIRRLVLALWFGADPSAVPSDDLNRIAERAYTWLYGRAEFSDAHALLDAARDARQGLI